VTHLQIPIKLPEKCLSCGGVNTFVQVVHADGTGSAVSMQLLTEADARKQEVILGGVHIFCRPHICKSCGFVALYYDAAILS